jgi:ADP-ribose pyrophosphatase YjhB (NUDIX family)
MELFCPACGLKSFRKVSEKAYMCGVCGFEFFHNAAAAVSVLLEYNGHGLMTLRAADPGQGMLDLPGGFIDHGETAEDALRREVREELALELGDLEYIGTFANEYNYRGILYHTLDIVFHARLDSAPETVMDKNEISGVEWVDLKNIPFERIAFKSVTSTFRNLQ